MSTVALVTDLIFRTKITSTAKSVGAELEIVASLDALRQALGEDPVATLLIDLDAGVDDPVEAIRIARVQAQPPRIVAYLSHVQTELAQQAAAAGADQVLPRSAFTRQLPDLLCA